MAFELPALPYDKNALEPYMSAETLEYHHDKHHQTYVTNLNKLVADTDMAGADLADIVKRTYGDESKAGVFNNASQHWNHILFWEAMKKDVGMPGALEKALTDSFGSVDKFKEEFCAAGAAQFGSGWCWLVSDGGQLKVTKTPNGVNPLCFGQTALLGCDVWEHSYYIDYRNRRPDYLKAFVDHLANWEFVAEQLAKAS